MIQNAKDLTKEAASSPRQRVGGYVILARMADKGRAMMAGNAGEYHFDCPLDNMLFEFKGVKGDEVKPLLESNASDDEVAKWLDSHGTKKSPEEVKAWSDKMESRNPSEDPERREWFAGECEKLGLNPEKTTLFDWLDADDRKMFGN